MKEIQSTTPLERVLELIWLELLEGAQRGRHAFHTPAIATVGHLGPAVRTVVLRAVDAETRTVICHTDTRSRKVAEIQADPRVEWHFYDREAKTQLRLTGTASLHHEDPLARERWSAAPDRSRACYHAAAGPGQPVAVGAPVEELPEGFPNFVVVRSVIETIDWLLLRGRGHLRARFQWQDGAWQGQRIAP